MIETATLTVKGVNSMTTHEMRELAKWLEGQIEKLFDEGFEQDDKYIARFYIEGRKRAA